MCPVFFVWLMTFYPISGILGALPLWSGDSSLAKRRDTIPLYGGRAETASQPSFPSAYCNTQKGAHYAQAISTNRVGTGDTCWQW